MPPQSNYNLRKIAIIGIIILIIAALIGFFAVRQKNKTTQENEAKNLFPFGNGTASGTGTGGTGSGTSTIPNPIPQNVLSTANADPLRLITTYPITGFFPFIQNVISTNPVFDATSHNTIMVSTSTPTDTVRFNAQQNGFLADAQLTDNSIIVNEKSDTQVPDAQEIWFTNSGNTAIYRSWDESSRTIDTFAGTLPTIAPLTYCQVPFTSILTPKSRGSEVKELEKYLDQKLSLTLPIDGVYGKKVMAEIEPLQTALNIPTTGVYDADTRDAINNDCLSITSAYEQKSDGVQSLSGSFLDSNIIRGTVSPDGSLIFFLKPTADGVVGMVAKSDGSGERQVFSSPLTEWKPQWINTTTIAMTTLASYQSDGYLYFLNLKNGNFEKVIGPIQGLTTNTNALGTDVLVGESTANGMELENFSTTTGTMTDLGLKTLPAKCAWEDNTTAICGVPQGVPDGNYPDDWYQGTVSFNDAFWTINTSTGATSNLFSPTQNFDSENPAVSPDGNYFYFMNKDDGTLWSYRLTSS